MILLQFFETIRSPALICILLFQKIPDPQTTVFDNPCLMHKVCIDQAKS